MGRPKLRAEFIDVQIFEATVDLSDPIADLDGLWADEDFCESLVEDFHHNGRIDEWLPIAFRDETGINTLPLEHAPAILTNIYWHDDDCLYARIRFCDNILGDAALHDSAFLSTFGGIHFDRKSINSITGQLLTWTSYIVYIGFDDTAIVTTLSLPFSSIGD